MTCEVLEAVPPLDAQQRIAVDLPCTACGYNLRTLPAAARCPECAAEVDRTLAFCREQPRWLEGVANSLIALVVLCVAIPVIGGLSALLFQLGMLAGVGALLVALLVTGALVIVPGSLFVLSSPPPAAREAAASRVSRWLVSIPALTAVVSVPIALVFADAAYVWPAAAVGVAGLLALACLPAALVWRVSFLMTYCHRADLVRAGRILMISIILYEAALVSAMVTPQLIALASSFPDEILRLVLGLIGIGGSVVTLIYLGVCGLALRRHARRLQKLAARAAPAPPETAGLHAGAPPGQGVKS